MKSALAAMCVIVLMAATYLSLSLAALNPPRAVFAAWFSLAAVITAQAVLTLIVVSMQSPAAPLRVAIIAGALMLCGIAAWRVSATLSSSHFEGYNLLLATMLVIQAVLTLIVEGRAAVSHFLRTSQPD
jgi:hypothetical protein